MNKTFLLILVAVIGIGALAWLGRPQSQSARIPNPMPAATSTVLKASESSFTFGTISMANGKVSHDIRVTNTGATPVTLGQLYTSCMCTSASLVLSDKTYGPFGMAGMGFIPRIDQALAPGQTAILTATFDPNAHGPAGVGHIERTITLENDNGTPLAVSFTADVTP